ncbi:rnase ii-like exoribonuclease [Leptolyngbya sp. Heron Island J]|uniref:ribonuclease R family protein n=1 Tax=Leptolyngbya sp. Heron Island J TaxID=1385935 RepID=UPI0003B9A59B|nr:ribonuclease R family protein [Leptolyngbya sp. Heron Island J]ESA33206.1 rnase ii-like exoribonuclease [Leptolyngbya sp. Heron Island J]
MNFSIASLLANFSNDKLVTTKTLEKKLNCSDDTDASDLTIALDALERIGVLEKERGKYRRIYEDDVIEGKLRCSSKGFCFAIQDEEEADDIYVREAHLNHAWNGDRVLVKVTKEGNRRRSPEGEVQLILERANSSVLARIKEVEGNDSLQAVPLDDRLLFQLDLKNQEEDELSQADLQAAIDHLVHVEILRYPIGQHLPHGRVAQILGSDAEAAADIDIVYCKHDLPRAFPEEVMMAAKALPNRVRKADIRKRIDLRDQPTVSIDADGAQVIDDALTLEQLEDGNWLLGIHVADVSYYVPSNNPIDQEAYRRGTSVYLADSPVPLLPPPLSTSLCALLADKERLTISVMVILSSEGEVLAYEVQPSVICNDHQLNYYQAQAILARDDKEAMEALSFKKRDLTKFKDCFEQIDQLFEVSKLLQQQRNQRGSFDLNLPDHVFPEEAGEELSHYLSPKFQHDDEGGLGVMVVSDLLPARRIVTECMLLANQLVAKHLKELGVPAIYRVHSTPDPGDVQELIKLANNMGLNLQLENEDIVLPKDYLGFVQQFSQSKAEKVLTYLLLSTLKPASYGSHPDGHFGLALEDGYTHFASPVRRYPDLLVHRVLHAVFDEGRDRKTTRSKDRVDLRSSSSHGNVSWSVLPPDIHNELEESLSHMTTHLTERERLAQEAESDLEGLKKAAFMQAHTGEVFHGLITGVQSYGFFVELEELLVEGLVHVSSLKDDWYEYRSRQQKLMGRKNRQQYRLGDRVEVQVKSVDYYRQQIDLVAVGGGSEAVDDDDDDITNEESMGRDDVFDDGEE